MAGANLINVASSAITAVQASELGQSLFAAAVTGQAGVTYSKVYYSFSKPNANFIYWDPSVIFEIFYFYRFFVLFCF